jgi:hypothetical protein
MIVAQRIEIQRAYHCPLHPAALRSGFATRSFAAFARTRIREIIPTRVVLVPRYVDAFWLRRLAVEAHLTQQRACRSGNDHVDFT